jgi:RNA 3'-terminal phosphate cyclase (ATP)
MHSGSGTLLRYSAALAVLTGEPLHMNQIRVKRDKPGLRPQHLEALRACSSFCSGRLEGDEVGSQEILFYPGRSLPGGEFNWDIGTAGSTTMLAFTVAPLALFADTSSHFIITGGLFQDFAPSAFHMQNVLFPLLRRMGAEAQLQILRPGYVPEGQGSLSIDVMPLDGMLQPLRMLDQGNVVRIGGIALSSHLEKERVSERMSGESLKLLKGYGYSASIESIEDSSAVQRGAALALWAETDTGCIIGADRAGKRGRRSENIADFVVNSLMEDISTGATTDRHLCDQLILFAALAGGRTEYVVPRVTDHIASNLWLVEKMLGTKSHIENNTLSIDGVGFQRARTQS